MTAPTPPPYGQPPFHPQPMYAAPQPPTSGWAVMSLIFGLLGLVVGCCTYGVFSLVAVVCGHVALQEIRRRGLRGDGMAKAGLVLGYLLVVPMVLMSFGVLAGI